MNNSTLLEAPETSSPITEPLRLCKIEPATDNQWDTIVAKCEYATYYQSREWAEIWNWHTNGQSKPAAKMLTFSDGVEVLYPLSVCKASFGLVSQYISSPGWMHGGWLSFAPLSEAHLEALWEFSTHYNLILRENPSSPYFSNPRLELCEYGDTHILNLEGGLESLHKLWAMEHPSFLENVKTARRKGVEIVEAQNLNDWFEYYKVYEATLSRWGEKFEGPNYEWRDFEFIYQLNSPHIKLWLARFEGKIVAGAFCFYQNKHAVGWHRAGLQEYFKYKSNSLLDFTIIEKCCQEGYRWLDLGPSGSSEGVARYKENLGGRKTRFNVYISKRANQKSVEYLKKFISRGR